MENLLTSVDLKKRLQWFIKAHGHSSIGGLNLIWTYLHYTDKEDVAKSVEDMIEMFRKFPESSDFEHSLDEMRSKSKILEGQIKFLSIPDDKKRELVEVIHGVKRNVDRLGNVLKNPSYEEECNVDKIVYQAVSELIQRYPATYYGSMIGTSDKNGDLVEIIYDGDEKISMKCNGFEIQLLIFNLMSNATDAIIGNGGSSSGKGKIWVSIGEKENMICIDVKDDGQVLSEEKIALLSHKMYFTTKGKDHGKGMKIIHDIVEKYNGKFDITSDLGSHVTDFKIEIPMRR